MINQNDKITISWKLLEGLVDKGIAKALGNYHYPSNKTWSDSVMNTIDEHRILHGDIKLEKAYIPQKPLVFGPNSVSEKMHTTTNDNDMFYWGTINADISENELKRLRGVVGTKIDNMFTKLTEEK